MDQALPFSTLSRTGPAHRARAGRPKPVASTILIVCVGMSILLYPVLSSLINNWAQQQVARDYAQQFATVPAQVISDYITRARQYNAAEAHGPIVDPWLSRVTIDNEDYQAYLHQLDFTEVMAQVQVPTINVNLPLYHGTSEGVLEQGLGHLYGSDLPVGGTGSHSVITGHSGLPTATMFDDLRRLREGDDIYITVMGSTLKYEVYSTEVVQPDVTASLQKIEGEDLLTLITCTPYGINSHRLLVHAHRVPMDPTEVSAAGGTFAWQWWMWGLIATSLLIASWLVSWCIGAHRDNVEFRGRGGAQ